MDQGAVKDTAEKHSKRMYAIPPNDSQQKKTFVFH